MTIISGQNKMLASKYSSRFLSIRFGNKGDKQFITDSIINLVQVGENLKKKPVIKGMDNVFDEIINDPKRYVIFVAEDEKTNEKLGAAVINIHNALHIGGKYAYLEELVIRPSARGTGVGSKLLKRIEEYSKENGLKNISLTQPPKGSQYDTERSKFYEANGFNGSCTARVKFFGPWFKVD